MPSLNRIGTVFKRRCLNCGTPGLGMQRRAACLTEVGYFRNDTRAHRRGEIPQVQSGAGRMAEGQDATERQLRRALRRLHEARGNVLQGRPTSRNLTRNIECDARRFKFEREARNRQWWPAIDKLTGLLNQFLNDQQSARAKAWKLRVRDYSAAVRWTKELGRPPWLLRCKDGSVCAGRSNGARALKKDWQSVFHGDRHYVPDAQLYMDRYGEWFPQRPTQQTLALCPEKLRRAVREMRHKAAGPDNWEARSLLQLPAPAWERLGQLLQCVERTGLWPPGLRAWRLCFIPKDSSNYWYHRDLENTTNFGRQHCLQSLGTSSLPGSSETLPPGHAGRNAVWRFEGPRPGDPPAGFRRRDVSHDTRLRVLPRLSKSF